MKTLSTLMLLASLGTATASPDVQPAVMETGTDAGTRSSARGVVDGYLVHPSGGELTAQMRFLTSQPVFSDEKVRFTDLALFGLGGRWALFDELEVSASVDLLAKQPSYTDEKPWQSVAVGLRTPIGKRKALALTGAGGHLIDHSGMWIKPTATVQWRKPIARILTFDLAGSVDGVSLSAPDRPSAQLAEVAGSASAQMHVEGVWGGWAGIGYAIPVWSRGSDPTTGLAIDPQPRLDFRVGTVMSLVKEWDLFAEFAVVDRGDLSNPATRLPIIDGGFDQQQVIFGVVRHIEAPKRRRANSDPMEISAR